TEEYELFSDSRLNKIKTVIPRNNLEQRLNFNPKDIKLIQHSDIIISHNEIQSLSIKKLLPKSYLIQFNHLLPFGQNLWFRDLAQISWKTADLVIVLSPLIKQWILNVEPKANINVWPTVFPNFNKQYENEQNIDILFIQRCSESNYTHHLEFIEA